MGFNEYEKFDAIGLAELIKKKEVSPLEVIESCIDRINERNPKLNAVIATNYHKIYETINKTIPEGLLGGVPFLLKETEIFLSGDSDIHLNLIALIFKIIYNSKKKVQEKNN